MTNEIFIASDIHGSLFYAEKVAEAYKNEKAEKLILLGDLLYHGPRNDLPKDYNPKGGYCTFKLYEAGNTCCKR